MDGWFGESNCVGEISVRWYKFENKDWIWVFGSWIMFCIIGGKSVNLVFGGNGWWVGSIG